MRRFAARMRLRAWVLVVTGVVSAACVFNACATSGQGPADTPTPVGPTGGSSGQNNSNSSGGSSGSSGSSGGSGSSSGSSSGATDDATLSNDSTTGDDAGSGADDSGDAGTATAQAPCASGQICVDLIPSGWTGYVQLLVGAADAGLEAGSPSCAGPYGAPQATGIANPVAAPADCSSCNTCLAGDAGPITCTVGIATANLLCTANGPTSPAQQNTCVQVNGANGSVTSPTVASATGTCAPSSALAPPSAPPAVACALTNDGGIADAGTGDGGSAAGPTCNVAQACANSITAPAGSPAGVCIYKSGVQTSCPPGHFSQLHVVGSSIADDRGCGCSCVNPTCPTDGYVAGYTSNNCSGNAAITIDAGTPCKAFGNANNSNSFLYRPSHGSFSGTCSAVDAGPSGGVSIDPAGATTYCCNP
jgi:hypothetical protein